MSHKIGVKHPSIKTGETSDLKTWIPTQRIHQVEGPETTFSTKKKLFFVPALCTVRSQSSEGVGSSPLDMFYPEVYIFDF